MQAQYATELLGIQRAAATMSRDKITAVKNHLQAEVQQVLADTLIPAADQQRLLQSALDKFEAEKSAKVIKIETKRKEDAKRKARTTDDGEDEPPPAEKPPATRER